MSSNTNVRAKWGQPHILFYVNSFDGLPSKCHLVSSITLPAALAGCWNIMSLHFQIRSAKQISFSQEAPPVQGPELREQARAQGLGTVSFPGCPLGAGSLEGKLVPGHACGV